MTDTPNDRRTEVSRITPRSRHSFPERFGDRIIPGAARFVSATLVLVSICLVAPAVAGGPALELSLLVYNTHGLSSLIAGDEPERRFPLIARHTHHYDLSLLQEDFAHHERLLAGLGTGSRATRGNPSRFSLCPFCSGSGLTTVSNLPSTWSIQIEDAAFSECSGWLGGLNDCLATKGLQFIELRTPAGPPLVVINTHLDAGRGSEDRRVRALQLEEIIAAVETKAFGEAVIVAGDLNLDADDPDDLVLLESFKKRLGLRDSGAHPPPDSRWEILDYILYRSGVETRLEVLAAGEDEGLEDEGRPLSDHPALFARFAISTTAPQKAQKE